MKDWRSQSHVKWDCKYHVVIVPKYRRRKFYGSLRSDIGQILRELCRQKDIELVKGNALPDHVHLLLGVPPKYSIANTVGFLKGKSAIRINRDLGKVKGSLLTHDIGPLPSRHMSSVPIQWWGIGRIGMPGGIRWEFAIEPRK